MPTEMREHGVAVVGPTTVVENVDAVASDGLCVAADATDFNPPERSNLAKKCNQSVLSDK